MTNKKLKKELLIIANNRENTIEKAVALEALERDNIKTFFFDLLQSGCISGMVSSLVYYTDTHTFFDTHYDQIEEIRLNYEENIGSLPIKDDLKNTLTWFAFEETAFQMANEFELEV